MGQSIVEKEEWGRKTEGEQGDPNEIHTLNASRVISP